MKFQYSLKRPDAETETAVFATVSHKGKRIKVYTGVSCLPKYWNAKDHKVRQSPRYRQGTAINAVLEKIKGLIESSYYNYKQEHLAEPSPEMLRKLIDNALGRSKEIKLSLFEFFTDFINRTERGQRQTVRGKLISPYKAKTYQTTLNKLQDFNPKLNFSDVDLDFYEDFTTWLRKKGFTENYVGGHIKNLKAVLSEATEKGLNNNLAFRSKNFTKPSEETDNIALNESELKAIESLDLSATLHLDRVRDLFIIGCRTGLRFSDFIRIKPENIVGNFIKIEQAKTGGKVVISLHESVKRIWEKYNGNLPKPITNQKFNIYLREVCQRVGCLHETVTKIQTKGGLKVSTKYEKWMLISSHCGRRSYATNAYLDGAPSISIMAVTGHKTEKAFLKYLKIDSETHAKIVAQYTDKKMKAV